MNRTIQCIEIGQVSFITKLAGFEYTKNLAGNFIDEGIPVIQGRNIKGGLLNYAAMKYISVETSNSLQRSQITKNNILISYVGTVGDKYIHENNKVLHLGSNVAKIVPNEKLINPRFLYYSLESPLFKNDLLSKTKGSVQSNINMRDLRTLRINIFELSEQKVIANILSSFDDKIIVNNKINKNLEELAQLLYKHWFIDFEFPDENGNPYKSSGGKMVESEFGQIPIDFEVKKIQEFASTVLGGTPARKNPLFWGEGYQWLKSGELNNFRITIGTEQITELGLASSAAKLMPAGTTLIAITGYVGLISLLEIEACANQSVVGVVPNEEYTKSYIYAMIKQEMPLIALKQTGSAQQHINKNDINTHRLVVPPISLIKKFESIVGKLNSKITNNVFENEHLTEMRELLLPKLISGEIRLPVEE